MYMEIAGDLVTERKLACILTLIRVPGIVSPIVRLFRSAEGCIIRECGQENTCAEWYTEMLIGTLYQCG